MTFKQTITVEEAEEALASATPLEPGPIFNLIWEYVGRGESLPPAIEARAAELAALHADGLEEITGSKLRELMVSCVKDHLRRERNERDTTRFVLSPMSEPALERIIDFLNSFSVYKGGATGAQHG